MLQKEKDRRGTWIALACVAGLLAVIVVLENTMQPTSMLFTVLKKGAVYALVACSLNLLNGFAGLFSLGQAATWPAYLAVAAAGLPSSTALAVSAVIFIVVLGAPFARKFERLRRRNGLRGINKEGLSRNQHTLTAWTGGLNTGASGS